MAESSRSTPDCHAIEAWFRAHEDGEFCVQPADSIWQRTGNIHEARTLIYTTKRHCLSRITGLSHLAQPVATMAGYGLPIDADLTSLSSAHASRVFIGDADPPDILIYAWLRALFPIAWHGVSDAFLSQHGNRDNTKIWIALSNSEVATVPKLDNWCLDYRNLLGEYCSTLLMRGFKIELEGAIRAD